MEAYLLDWLNLFARWLHFIAGIAWIGSSFYFIWLDNHLEAPREPADGAKGVGGEVWSVHGGGFYHAQKYRVAPAELPQNLHWFKWEAYTTWLSGMFLLMLVYWLGAEVYLVDPAVAELSAPIAIAISAGIVVGGWLIYDGLCRTRLVDNDALFGGVLFLLVAVLAWGLCQLFSGRAAYIHFGAVLGTIMVANVFFVIIPGQKKMVAAAARGEAPDPLPGIRGKQRSVHNTHFTLPVLFTMISNHYAVTYGHRYNWLILVAIALAGALIRIWFVARHRGSAAPLPAAAAAIVLILVVAAVAPRGGSPVPASASIDDVRVVIEHRCASCHAARPAHPAFPAPPSGVVFDNDAQIIADAERIYQQTVVTRAMPIGNLTGISEEERGVIEAWYLDLADGSD